MSECVCVCVEATPPPPTHTLDDSLKAKHGCFMYCFSVCQELRLPPRLRFTTGRDGFSEGTEGMMYCMRWRRDTEREPLKEKSFRIA